MMKTILNGQTGVKRGRVDSRRRCTDLYVLRPFKKSKVRNLIDLFALRQAQTCKISLWKNVVLFNYGLCAGDRRIESSGDFDGRKEDFRVKHYERRLIGHSRRRLSSRRSEQIRQCDRPE